MSWKSRSSVAILAATVLTGAGAVAIANAVSSAQATGLATTTAAPATAGPTAAQRAEQLARAADDLQAQVRGLEQAVAAGAATVSDASPPRTETLTTTTPSSARPEFMNAAPDQEPSDD